MVDEAQYFVSHSRAFGHTLFLKKKKEQVDPLEKKNKKQHFDRIPRDSSMWPFACLPPPPLMVSDFFENTSASWRSPFQREGRWLAT